MKQNIENSKRRIKEFDMLTERIYEDNVLVKISDEGFYRMSANYEKEQKNYSPQLSVTNRQSEKLNSNRLI